MIVAHYGDQIKHNIKDIDSNYYKNIASNN